MADSAQNRTEQATPKRKAEARSKGQIALSRDAAMAVALLGSFAALYWMTPGIMERLRHSLAALAPANPWRTRHFGHSVSTTCI